MWARTLESCRWSPEAEPCDPRQAELAGESVASRRGSFEPQKIQPNC